MSAEGVIRQTVRDAVCCNEGGDATYWAFDDHILDSIAIDTLAALKAAGFAVIELPSVAHKGPHDTDAKFFRQVADRMEWPSKRIDYLGGNNVRQAVRQLLIRAADAAEETSS